MQWWPVFVHPNCTLPESWSDLFVIFSPTLASSSFPVSHIVLYFFNILLFLFYSKAHSPFLPLLMTVSHPRANMRIFSHSFFFLSPFVLSDQHDLSLLQSFSTHVGIYLYCDKPPVICTARWDLEIMPEIVATTKVPSLTESKPFV